MRRQRRNDHCTRGPVATSVADGQSGVGHDGGDGAVDLIQDDGGSTTGGGGGGGYFGGGGAGANDNLGCGGGGGGSGSRHRRYDQRLRRQRRPIGQRTGGPRLHGGDHAAAGQRRRPGRHDPDRGGRHDHQRPRPPTPRPSSASRPMPARSPRTPSGTASPPRSTAQASIDTFLSNFDTVLAAYTHDPVTDNFDEVASNNDEPGGAGTGSPSIVTFRIVDGEEYLVAVDGVGGDTGDVALQYTIAQAASRCPGPGGNRGTSARQRPLQHLRGQTVTGQIRPGGTVDLLRVGQNRRLARRAADAPGPADLGSVHRSLPLAERGQHHQPGHRRHLPDPARRPRTRPTPSGWR